MKRFNFTLIELLVVVSIVAILAALLLPSLSKAREKAYEIKCVGNMKQIGIMTISYSNDNKDELMPTFHTLNGGGSWERRSLLEAIGNVGMGIAAGMEYIPLPDKKHWGASVWKTNRPPIFKCPKIYKDGWASNENWCDYVYPRDTGKASVYMFKCKYFKLSGQVISYCIAGDISCLKGLHSNGTEALKADGSAKYVPFRNYINRLADTSGPGYFDGLDRMGLY